MHNFILSPAQDCSASDVLEVAKASYLDGFTLLIEFNDGKEQTVDFSAFLLNTEKQCLRKYQSSSNFKSFKIEEGNLVWGKNWDLIFPIHQLYQGKIQ